MFARWEAIALVLSAFFVFTSHSQNALRITYGDTVGGEITSEQYAFEYLFIGGPGDVIAVEMRSTDRSLNNPLIAPVLILQDSAGGIIADTTAQYSVDDAILIAEIPRRDDYRITATREGGASGNSTGMFTLALTLIPVIDMGTPVIGTAGSGGGSTYLAARTETPFVLSYRRIFGEFYPQLALNRITPADGGLEPVAVLSGGELDRAIAGVFEANITYIITVTEGPFDFYFEDVSVEFELQVNPAN